VVNWSPISRGGPSSEGLDHEGILPTRSKVQHLLGTYSNLWGHQNVQGLTPLECIQTFGAIRRSKV
jgi:hypothetical protein